MYWSPSKDENLEGTNWSPSLSHIWEEIPGRDTCPNARYLHFSISSWYRAEILVLGLTLSGSSVSMLIFMFSMCKIRRLTLCLGNQTCSVLVPCLVFEQCGPESIKSVVNLGSFMGTRSGVSGPYFPLTLCDCGQISASHGELLALQINVLLPCVSPQFSMKIQTLSFKKHSGHLVWADLRNICSFLLPDFDIPICERFGKGGTFPRQYHLSQSRKDYSDGKKMMEGWRERCSVQDLSRDGKCRMLVPVPGGGEI